MVNYIRGEDFQDFAIWLGRQLSTRAFDSGNPLPTDAARKILEELEPAIARKVFLEAANIVRTHPSDPSDANAKGDCEAALIKRAQAL
jgi:hypothetical protein